MKATTRFALLTAIFAAAIALPAAAGNDDKRFKLTGEARMRWEYVENFTDANDDVDDSGDFFPYRARIAAEGDFGDGVRGVVEIQNYGFFGNEGVNAIGDPLNQTFRSGFVGNETELYRGFIEMNEIRGSDWSVRIGRQEHKLGRELHLGDLDFYNGRFLDGLRARRDGDGFDLDLFFYVITEGTPITTVEDVWFTGASASFDVARGHELEPYVLLAHQTDRTSGGGDLYTVGALYEHPADRGRLDWSVEYAQQFGTFEPNGSDQDYGGSILEAQLGIGLDDGHRIHVGTLIASGDEDPLDNDLDGFNRLLPDNHANNRLGDLDLFGGATVAGSGFIFGMSNVTDYTVGYTWTGNDEARRFMASLHRLSLTEEIPLVGITEDDLGLELDLVYDYRFNEHLGFQVGAANLFAGDALDQVVGAGADDILRGWWQARLRW